ncbi:MAG: type II secretion system inner membrane protein GspF [Deltaproteobacteria bacterium]|nr:type II secretion system inner membrane protein GspF [Deltaproteobacteria bacterium]
MPVFEYKGFNKKGKNVKGLKDADTEKAARAALRKDGIMVTDVKASGSKGKKNKSKDGKEERTGFNTEIDFSRFQRISVDDIALATRQLATLLQAGVPMVESLTALIDQVENPALKRIYAEVKQDVNEGIGLHIALAKHKDFDHIYVNMVRAAEASGTLDMVLEKLAEFKEGQAALKSQIVGALTYPIIMIIVGAGIMGVLFTVVVPRITRIFEHANAQLPWMTRVLIFMSETTRDYWWAMILVAVGTVFAIRRWVGTKKGRKKWDKWQLKLPVFGMLFRMVAVARFARTMGTLLKSGVGLLACLDIVENVVSNATIGKAIAETREAVREGEGIAPPLKRSGQFPPMVTHMVAIGEKTGQLEKMLERIAIAYEQRVDVRLKAMTSLLEPIMILGMGGSVGFIVFSILKPILEMNTLIK